MYTFEVWRWDRGLKNERIDMSWQKRGDICDDRMEPWYPKKVINQYLNNEQITEWLNIFNIRFLLD